MKTKKLVTILLFLALVGFLSLYKNTFYITKTPYVGDFVYAKDIIEPKINFGDFRIIGESFVANVSAYSSSPDETDDSPFISANQNKVFKGLIACPRTFEFGTYFLIQGKLYYCGDRFNKRFELLRNKDNMLHLDIWMETKEEAIEFGRQYLIAMPLRKI